MKEIAELLGEVRALDGLRPEHVELIAGCGRTASFRDGELLLRQGGEANAFLAIRSGDVGLEIAVPGRGPLVIETLHGGDLVGWSWLFAPYRVRFDARARGVVRAIAFDGACLRGKCEADHDLGYELMRRFAEIVVERLQATRVQALDLYANPATQP